MTTTLPIRIIKLEDESYHLMVDVTINNETVGHLIVDTGASKTVFDKTFITPHLTEIEEIDDNHSSGINAMIDNAQIGQLELLSFGELILTNYQCLTLDLSHINALYKKYADKYIAGLLGSDFLLKYGAIIDYSKKTLSINML